MSSSRSSSPVSSATSPNYEDDLFKKFKLKHHLTAHSLQENDDQVDPINSDEWTSQSTTPELDVEPHFESYYRQQTSKLIQQKLQQHLLTPDIDELQQRENAIVQSLNRFHSHVSQVRESYKSSSHRIYRMNRISIPRPTKPDRCVTRDDRTCNAECDTTERPASTTV